MLKTNISYEIFNKKVRLGSLSGDLFISHDNKTNFTFAEIAIIQEAMVEAREVQAKFEKVAQ